MDKGHPSRRVFSPTKKDVWCLSLDRSAAITAKQSYENYTLLGLKSAAVYGVETGEFEKQPHPIECHASPIQSNPHHSHADFNGLSKTQRKTKSTELLRIAVDRGKLHP
ncbi:MAG: hypothetical protein ACNYPE_11225 [Candidatus Azotimanducaceae bacterium WSBS_2022_MAG_OTU7]